MMAVSLGDRALRDEVRDQACLDFEGAQVSRKTGQEGFTGPQPLCLLPILFEEAVELLSVSLLSMQSGGITKAMTDSQSPVTVVRVTGEPEIYVQAPVLMFLIPDASCSCVRRSRSYNVASGASWAQD